MQHRYFISKYVMKQKLVALLKEAEKKLIRMTKTGNDFEKLSKFFSLHHVNLTPDSLELRNPHDKHSTGWHFSLGFKTGRV